MKPRTIAASVASAFLFAVFLASRAGVVPLAFVFVYLGMSAASIVVHANDKLRARQGRRRIPETTLHAVELLCGWPGSLVAQWQFAHKTRKVGYQVVFWAIVLLHVAALALAWSGT